MPSKENDAKITRRRFLGTSVLVGTGLAIFGLFRFMKKQNKKVENKTVAMKKIISTKNAPSAIGPYSQAILINGFLYTSGQICINPSNGELVMDTIQNETNQVMNNLKAILTEADMDFSHVVKTGIFLQSMNDFATVNEIYASYFAGDFPARETVEVAKLPKGVNVEISMVAFNG